MNYIFYDWTVGGLPEVLISTEDPIRVDDIYYHLSKHWALTIKEVSPYVTQIDVKPFPRRPIEVLQNRLTYVKTTEMGQKV